MDIHVSTVVSQKTVCPQPVYLLHVCFFSHHTLRILIACL